ncbi:MAG TPA: dephospho-CoA kinase [Bacteroidales bacterium]|nr:dephospho-CoA kinase [Bacteroidales bacterium]
MIKVGITGGIGSGKSIVCALFAGIGIPVYDSDSRAKKLMNEDETIKQSLTGYFGKEIYAEGTLNRSLLAQRIFNNKPALEFVNNIVHPAVRNDFLQWASCQNAPYVIEEAALLFESNAYQLLDKVITVSCPEELRIQRVIERDKTTRENVLQRIKNQLPESEKVNRSDFVIINDDQHSLIEQVNNIHIKLKAL